MKEAHLIHPLNLARALACLALMLVHSRAHVFVGQPERAGAYPDYDGGGFIGAVYLNLPLEAVEHIIAAESYMNAHEPDFTFRTWWVDFPAGPTSELLDADLATIGDFLNDYLTEVSNPALLESPMSHFAIRFTGYLKVTLEDESRFLTFIGLPTWVDFGTQGYDGYKLKVGVTAVPSYRVLDSNKAKDAWENFGPSCELTGLFPIEFTYFNRYDPTGELNAPFAGVELYSWHGGGLPWPAGARMTHAVKGAGTIVPPRVIYQLEDVLPVSKGNFTADAHRDLRDFQWVQNCFQPPTGGFVILAAGCNWMDFNEDGDVDWSDAAALVGTLAGPLAISP